MANRPSHDALPRKLMPRPGRPELPLYPYDFPFTTRYAAYTIDHARRHHLSLKIVEEEREFFRGHAVLDLADLDDERLPVASGDEDLELFAISISQMLMAKDLGRTCGFMLEMGRPFSDDRDGIISPWSNHNFDDRFDRCFDRVKVVEVLQVAINESEGQTSVRPQWWFDWDNYVGVFTSIA